MSEVAETGSNLPALAPTPALDIGPEDIQLPRIYIGQFMSEAVKHKLVDAGAIFTGIGADDVEPVVVGNEKDAVRLHVLAMRRGKSTARPGEELETYAFNDPDAPADAYTTYNYVVAIPQVDDSLPYKLLLKRTGATAAKKMNLLLQQAAYSGPAWELAFDLTSDFRESKNGDYWVPVIRSVDPNPKDVEVAAKLAAFVPAEPDSVADSDQPGI